MNRNKICRALLVHDAIKRSKRVSKKVKCNEIFTFLYSSHTIALLCYVHNTNIFFCLYLLGGRLGSGNSFSVGALLTGSPGLSCI